MYMNTSIFIFPEVEKAVTASYPRRRQTATSTSNVLLSVNAKLSYRSLFGGSVSLHIMALQSHFIKYMYIDAYTKFFFLFFFFYHHTASAPPPPVSYSKSSESTK